MEDTLREKVDNFIVKLAQVLILVLMEDTLRAHDEITTLDAKVKS